MQTVLVTGGAGYIGTVLIRHLLHRGYSVKCVDRCFFGEDKLATFVKNDNFVLIKDDIRRIDASAFSNVDTVIDMAALSNDPAGNIDPDLTWKINQDGRLRIACMAKQAGVRKYILSSSCSVYGFNENIVDERSLTHPLTTYAKANLGAEKCLELRDRNFTPVVLRLATVFGISPRMRFDLAVNIMTAAASQRASIDVLGQGMQWRPFVHVEDVAEGILRLIDKDHQDFTDLVFNFGSNANNMKIITLAFLIRELLPFDIKVNLVKDDLDDRSYQVSFDRLSSFLNWAPNRSVALGIKEVYEAYKSGVISDSSDTVTSNWYRYLLNAEQIISRVAIDGKLF